VRIVAGRFRRRKLESNPGSTTRPITDFVKESLFERLQHHLADKRVADVFSGTGTIGLEALSRGAATAIFIEQDPKAFVLLKKNVAALGVENDTMCWQTDVFRCSFRPKNVERLLPCDVVFLDPPYKMIEGLRGGSPLSKSLERIARDEFTAPDALLVLRTPTQAEFDMPPMWRPWDELPRVEFTTMEIHLFRRSPAAAPAEASTPADEHSSEETEPPADSAETTTASDSEPSP
jgi:16S rRNA (guanine966-N2)-methyltransferase